MNKLELCMLKWIVWSVKASVSAVSWFSSASRRRKCCVSFTARRLPIWVAVTLTSCQTASWRKRCEAATNSEETGGEWSPLCRKTTANTLQQGTHVLSNYWGMNEELLNSFYRGHEVSMREQTKIHNVLPVGTGEQHKSRRFHYLSLEGYGFACDC